MVSFSQGENTHRADGQITSTLQLLEAAEVGDRGLDAEILLALEGGEIVWKQNRWFEGSEPSIRRPSKNHVGGFASECVHHVTTSIDAALQLAALHLPANWIGFQSNRGAELNESWSVWIEFGGDPESIECDAASPALALCKAILKAKQGLSTSTCGMKAESRNEPNPKDQA